MKTIKYRQGLGVGSILIVCLLCIPAVVYAHAQLLHTEPADGAVLDTAPGRVRLFFSEPIEPDFYSLQVYAQDHKRVDRNNARIAPDNVTVLETTLQQLGGGTYTVAWRALSIDGHVVNGVFAFSVGAAVAGPRPLLDLPAAGAPFALGAAVRWLEFLGLFVLVGGFGFLPLILVPALRSTGVAPDAVLARARRGFLATAWPALVLLLGLSLLALLVESSTVSGVPLLEVLRGHALTRLLVGTRYGAFWVLRLFLLFGMVALLTAASVKSQSGRLGWLGLVCGALLLLTISDSGHASSVPQRSWLAVGADWLHLIAGALWIGGLTQLVAGLLPAVKASDAASRRILLARAVKRFSWMAGLSVATLVLTGVYAGLLHVPSWQALADTVYGAALSTKLVMFVPLLFFGALNLLVIHPRFVRLARTKAAGYDATGVRLFRFFVLGELTLALLVLAATGVLTGLAPATNVSGGPFAETRTVGELAITLSVTPNQAGTNRFDVALAGRGGQPVSADRVAITLGSQEMNMGQSELQLQPIGNGRYEASANVLSMGGRWGAQVVVRRSGAPASGVAFQFVTGEARATSRVAFSPARIVLNALNLRAAAGALAILLALLIFLQLLGLRRARARRMGLLVGGTLLLVGLFVTGTALAAAYRASLPNPVPATPASLVLGRQTYVANCAGCHGLSGRGDGPAGYLLRPRPADFRVHMAAGHTDAQLFDWISHGVGGTAMPAFQNRLSQDQIWNVINYIRTFAQPAGTGR